ncbi:hypothetical protein Cni_G29078 [Canna indica]|uniref:Uncharacterized protein n=1 Tax=Canna indica TaxID=4628 RepID=A0AAQ3L4I5_9LILI|nr:hypothetical protein Cni_G29078 [Canna indica]
MDRSGLIPFGPQIGRSSSMRVPQSKGSSRGFFKNLKASGRKTNVDVFDLHPRALPPPSAKQPRIDDAHCVDLMMKDIGDIPMVKSTVKKAQQITHFIYNHTRTPCPKSSTLAGVQRVPLSSVTDSPDPSPPHGHENLS